MRNWRRIISILLTAAMLFTMNTGVYADEANMTVNSAEEAETEEATMPEAAKTAAAQTSVDQEKTTGYESEPQGETQGESSDETPEDDTGGDSPTEEIRVEETVAKEEITEEAQVAMPVEEELVEEVQEVSSNISSDGTKAQVSQGNAEGEAESETAEPEEEDVPAQTTHYRAQESTDINSAVEITSVSNGMAAKPDHDYSISGDTIIVSGNSDNGYKGIVISFKATANIKLSANEAGKGIVVLSANKDFSGVAKAELINGDSKALEDCSGGADTTVLIDKGSSEYGLFKYADVKTGASVQLLIAKEAFAGSEDTYISISKNGSVTIAGALGLAKISGNNILQKTESSNSNYTYAGNGENDESGTYAAVFGTGDGVSAIKSFKVNHFATPDEAKISGNDRVKTNEFYFWLENPVAGAEYKGAVFTGENGKTLSKDGISTESGKYEFHATGLDAMTTYYPAVRRVSGNGMIAADGVLYMPSEWSKHDTEKVTTKFNYKTVIEGLEYDYIKIGLEGVTIQATGKNLGKFRIRVAASVNDYPSAETFRDNLLTYDTNTEKYECSVNGLKRGTEYKVFLSVNSPDDAINEKGDSILVLSTKFKTVNGYSLRFDKALPSAIPYRTTKAIGEYINNSATLYVNDTISLNTAGSRKYAVFYNPKEGYKSEPIIDYTVTTLKGDSETYLNSDDKKSLYDYVYNVDGLKYKDTQTVSINAKLFGNLKKKDPAMTEPLAVSHTLNYTKSTVTVSVDNAVLNDKDHTLEDGDVKYKYIVEDLEGFDGKANVNEFIEQKTTGNAVKAFGAYTVVDASGRSSALVSLNNVAGTGTIAINESNINLLSWNNAEAHKLFTDEKDIELKAYKTPSTFYVVPNAKDKITVTPSVTSRTVEYGIETDSKGKTAVKKENVEKIFKPVVNVAGSVLKSSQFDVEYLILSTNTAADTVAKNWDKCTVSGVELKSFHKGSTVYAYAKIKITGEEVVETFMSSPCAITIVPRRLKLYFNTDRDGKAVSSNSSFTEVRYDLNRDRTASFPDKSAITRGGGGNAAVLYNSYTHAIPVISGDGFDTGLMKADGSMIISDNVVLKGSEADVTRPGWQSVDFSYTRKAGTEDFEVTEQRGYIYVNAAGIFHVRLEAWIEGKQVLSDEYDLKYQDGGKYKLTELIADSDGTKAKRIAALDKEDMGKLLTDVDGKRLKLIGWEYDLVDDGSISKNDVAVGSLSETSIKAGRDYTFTARFKKYVTDGGEGGIYVETIPNVFYTGQTHKSAYWSMDNYDELTARNQKGKYNNGTTVYDVQIAVKTDIESVTSEDRVLKEGIDYTVKLKNAKNASMVYDEKEGLYKLKNNETSKRPQAVITGKGSYKGFTATVYFNILPKAINEATVTGLLDTYYHNGKKLNKKIKVKATDACYWTQKNGRTGKKTMTLKAFNEAKKTGDYSIEIYKANDNARGWTRLSGVTNPNKIKDKGHYLVVLVGHNNYTGINPYNLTLTAEDEKSLMPQINDLDANQMFIETDPSFLLNNAKITLKSGFSILKVGDTVSASSVIDKVVINKKVVSADAYEAVFSEYYDENKKKLVPCEDGLKTVSNAGSYRITIVPSKGSPYHGSKLSKKFKIKGIKLKAADLKDTLYYYYENSSGNKIYKKYNGTAIDYCGGEEIHIKISGNSTVSADHQFLSYTYMNKNNKPFDFTSFKLDQYSDPEYTYKSGTYKVTAYGLGPYYGSKVTVKYKIAGIDLNSSKYVGGPGSGKLIEIGLYSQANYNVGGTMPQLWLSVNGTRHVGSVKVTTNAATKKTTISYSYGWLPGSGITYKDKNGSMSFTIKVTNNTTVGKDATVTIKGKGGATGTWKKNFRVVRNSVTKVYSYDERGSGVDGYIYADVIDDKKGSSERKVELYQAYYKAYDSKLKKAPIAFKKIGTSTKGEASECFKPTFHKVTTSSGSASGNKTTTTTTTLPWLQVNLTNGTKTDRYYFAKSIFSGENYHNWTKETKSIKYVTVSLNGARNAGKTYTLPMSGSIDFAGDDVSVVRKDSESDTDFSSILLKDKSGRPLYVNNIRGTVSADSGSLSKDDNWIPLYDTPYTVTLSDGTTISQNYVIVSQKPARATSQGTVKITVKLVRRVPASVEEYKYGGKSKTFSYKIKKAANSVL